MTQEKTKVLDSVIDKLITIRQCHKDDGLSEETRHYDCITDLASVIAELSELLEGMV